MYRNYFRIVRFAFVTLSCLSLFSCQEIPQNVGPDTPEEVSLAFSLNELSIPIGDEGSLNLLVTPSERVNDVELMLADEKLVSINEKNLVEGGISLKISAMESLGSTTILAILDDQMAKCAITVDPITVTKISLDKSNLTLKVREEHTLVASLEPVDATSPMIAWSTSNDEIVSVENGKLTAIAPGNATITASCQGLEAKCEVEVQAVLASSMELKSDSQVITEKTVTESESFLIDAVVLPEDITEIKITWTVDDNAILELNPYDAYAEDNISSVKVTALSPGTATITANIDGIEKKVSVKVEKKEDPIEPAKIGDYYYSDGTWSDGGLISISSDGTNAKWKEEKPAPIEGKTVIGIVFQTNSNRFASEHQEAGHTHGLVFSLKAAHSPKDSLTRFSFDDGFSCLGAHRLGSSWYDDIFGYRWTQTVLNQYKGNLSQCPAFDWTTTDFSPAAPANTSGWFVPSIGQLWDFIVNLGGVDVANTMLGLRQYESDITWFSPWPTLSYNPLERLNSHWAKVPKSMKEDLFITVSYSSACELMSSTLYTTEPAICSFWICGGEKPRIEAQPSWCNDRIICHPILAF